MASLLCIYEAQQTLNKRIIFTISWLNNQNIWISFITIGFIYKFAIGDRRLSQKFRHPKRGDTWLDASGSSGAGRGSSICIENPFMRDSRTVFTMKMVHCSAVRRSNASHEGHKRFRFLWNIVWKQRWAIAVKWVTERGDLRQPSIGDRLCTANFVTSQHNVFSLSSGRGRGK